jgi:hypothetical protein
VILSLVHMPKKRSRKLAKNIVKRNEYARFFNNGRNRLSIGGNKILLELRKNKNRKIDMKRQLKYSCLKATIIILYVNLFLEFITPGIK